MVGSSETECYINVINIFYLRQGKIPKGIFSLSRMNSTFILAVQNNWQSTMIISLLVLEAALSGSSRLHLEEPGNCSVYSLDIFHK